MLAKPDARRRKEVIKMILTGSLPLYRNATE